MSASALPGAPRAYTYNWFRPDDLQKVWEEKEHRLDLSLRVRRDEFDGYSVIDIAEGLEGASFIGPYVSTVYVQQRGNPSLRPRGSTASEYASYASPRAEVGVRISFLTGEKPRYIAFCAIYKTCDGDMLGERREGVSGSVANHLHEVVDRKADWAILRGARLTFDGTGLAPLHTPWPNIGYSVDTEPC